MGTPDREVRNASVKADTRTGRDRKRKQRERMKIRINDLARELEVKSKAILDVLTAVGVSEHKTHSSSLEAHEAELVRKYLQTHGEPGAAPASARDPRRWRTSSASCSSSELE